MVGMFIVAFLVTIVIGVFFYMTDNITIRRAAWAAALGVGGVTGALGFGRLAMGSGSAYLILLTILTPCVGIFAAKMVLSHKKDGAPEAEDAEQPAAQSKKKPRTTIRDPEPDELQI